jgi:hypothetical protein
MEMIRVSPDGHYAYVPQAGAASGMVVLHVF